MFFHIVIRKTQKGLQKLGNPNLLSTPLNEGVTDIVIDSSILRNSLNTDISTNDLVNGRIGIVP